MQNPHANWRLACARRLAKRIATREGVRAIVVAGSVARGYADAYSDVEIPVFWERLPGGAARRALAADLGGDFLHGYDGPAREDQLLVDGLQIDLWHITVAREEAVLRAVLVEKRFDLGGLNALDTLRACIPLYGHTLVRAWKWRAREYPDALAEAVIQHHLGSFRLGELVLHARRGNPTAFYAELCALQQAAFLVLLALNRCYFPTFKWMYPTLEALPVKPVALGRRFERAFQLPCEEAIADTRQCLEETLRLVEREFPQLDTAPVVQRLAYERARHATEGKLRVE